MSTTMALAISATITTPGRPLKDTSDNPGAVGINGTAERAHPGDPEAGSGDHGRDSFGDILASLLAACTLCAPATGGSTAPNATASSATPSNAGFAIAGSVSLEGDITFEGAGTGEVAPVPVVNDSLHNIVSMGSSAIGSVTASLPAGDLGEAIVDRVGEVLADVREMGQSAKEVPASRAGLGFEAQWAIDAGLGKTSEDAPEGVSEPGPAGPDPLPMPSSNNADAANGARRAHQQPARASVELLSSMVGESGSLSGGPGGEDTGADTRAVDLHGNSGLAATLSVKVGTGPSPVPAPTASSPDNPVAPAPTAQLVEAIAPLRVRGNGTYDLTLELHPAELGAVRVRAVFENGTIQLHLQADSPATRDLLQDSLGGLRQALADVGLSGGELSVGTQAGWQGSAPHGFRRQQDGAGGQSVPSSTAPRTLEEFEPTGSHHPTSATALDVLL